MSGGDLWIMALILPPSVTKSRLCRLTTEPVPSCSASWVSLLHLPCLWLINMTKKNKVANTHGKKNTCCHRLKVLLRSACVYDTPRKTTSSSHRLLTAVIGLALLSGPCFILWVSTNKTQEYKQEWSLSVCDVRTAGPVWSAVFGFITNSRGHCWISFCFLGPGTQTGTTAWGACWQSQWKTTHIFYNVSVFRSN